MTIVGSQIGKQESKVWLGCCRQDYDGFDHHSDNPRNVISAQHVSSGGLQDVAVYPTSYKWTFKPCNMILLAATYVLYVWIRRVVLSDAYRNTVILVYRVCIGHVLDRYNFSELAGRLEVTEKVRY